MVRTLLSRTWPLVAAVGLALSAHAAAPVKLSANTSEVRDFIAVSATVGYAATAGGGLWKTTDAGANWSKTTLAAKTVYKISANSASGGARLYAATDTGLYRSTDSGATWTQLTQDITRAVAVDPLSAAGGPDTILFGVTGAGVYKSTDSGTTITRASTGLDSTDVLGIVYYPGQSAFAYVVLQCNVEDAPAPLSGNWGGVYRTSNANAAGPTWSVYHTGITVVDSTKPCVSAIAANGTTVVVGVKDYSTNQGNTYRITSTGAASWTASATNPFGVEWLGPDFSNANGFFLGSNQFGPYRSTDSGANFTQIYSAGTDPDFVTATYGTGAFTATTWVAGINGLGLFRSTAGASPVGGWILPTTPVKADRVNDLTNHSAIPATYYMAVKNGGVQKTTNSGSTWSQLNTGFGQVYSFSTTNIIRNVEVIGAHPNNGNVVAASMRAFGLYQLTGGTSWAQVSGFVNAVDHKPQSFVISPAGKVYYTLFDSGAGTPGGLFMATATGTTIGTLASQGVPIFEAAPQLGVAPAAGRIRLMPQDPENHAYLIMYDSLPYRTGNGGGSWARITVNAAYREGGFQRHAFFDITQKPSNGAVLVAPTNHGIYKSTDFGGTWSYVTSTGLPSTALSSMVYHAGGTLFGGDWSGLIYCSTDDGTTWTAVGNTQSSIKDMKYLNGAVHILTDGAGVWTKDNTCP